MRVGCCLSGLLSLYLTCTRALSLALPLFVALLPPITHKNKYRGSCDYQIKGPGSISSKLAKDAFAKEREERPFARTNVPPVTSARMPWRAIMLGDRECVRYVA